MFASYIASYKTTEEVAWVRFGNILIFDFLLLFVALREAARNIVGELGYKTIAYLLINHFFDTAIGLEGWSWNDFLTILVIVIEFILNKHELSSKRNK